jgi:hypothetical protein
LSASWRSVRRGPGRPKPKRPPASTRQRKPGMGSTRWGNTSLTSQRSPPLRRWLSDTRSVARSPRNCRDKTPCSRPVGSSRRPSRTSCRCFWLHCVLPFPIFGRSAQPGQGEGSGASTVSLRFRERTDRVGAESARNSSDPLARQANLPAAANFIPDSPAKIDTSTSKLRSTSPPADTRGFPCHTVLLISLVHDSRSRGMSDRSVFTPRRRRAAGGRRSGWGPGGRSWRRCAAGETAAGNICRTVSLRSRAARLGSARCAGADHFMV